MASNQVGLGQDMGACQHGSVEYPNIEPCANGWKIGDIKKPKAEHLEIIGGEPAPLTAEKGPMVTSFDLPGLLLGGCLHRCWVAEG